MDDKEWLERLQDGPLERSGFDDRLRARIHERIRDPRSGRSKRWTLPLAKAGIAALAFVLVASGIWAWGYSWPKGADEPFAKDDPASPPTPAVSVAPVAQAVRSGVLIGLRKDPPRNAGGEVSYRTVLVVPKEDGNGFEVAAAGPGIWMPYKQQFWKVDGISDTLGKGTETLISAPSNRSLPERAVLNSPVRRTEKLLFAGNKYVAVQRSIAVDADGNAVDAGEVWVKDVTQLSADAVSGASGSSGAKTVEPHYKLSDIEATDDSAATADQWTIARAPGKWVAKVPGANSNAEGAEGFEKSIANWRQIEAPLTSKAVSHDNLALTWEEVRELEPAAVDAFTSPTEDVAVFVVNGAVELFPYRANKSRSDAFKVRLDPGETIVMVQWAVDDHVDSWKRQLSAQIPPARTDGL